MTLLSGVILAAVGLALLYAFFVGAVSGGIRHARDRRKRDGADP